MRSSKDIVAELKSLRDSFHKIIFAGGFIPHEGDEVDIMFNRIKSLKEELRQARLQEAQAQEKERLTRQLYSFRRIE